MNLFGAICTFPINFNGKINMALVHIDTLNQNTYNFHFNVADKETAAQMAKELYASAIPHGEVKIVPPPTESEAEEKPEPPK